MINKIRRVNRPGWESGIISGVGEDIFVLKEVEGKYPERCFVIGLVHYRKPIPSKSKERILDWGSRSAPEVSLSIGDKIVFEKFEEDVIGWCLWDDYIKTGFESIRKTSVTELVA